MNQSLREDDKVKEVILSIYLIIISLKWKNIINIQQLEGKQLIWILQKNLVLLIQVIVFMGGVIEATI